MVGSLNQVTEATVHALKDKAFVANLRDGLLAPLTEMVKSDTSLCLELRGNYINIYYRGGNLMKVSTTRSADIYSIFFDTEYFKSENVVDLPETNVQCKGDVEQWISASPYLKRAMDNHFAKYQKYEREIQQLVLRDNNFGPIAGSTDYYMCDIEYRSGFGQFDMIAVEWPSTLQGISKQAGNRRLVFVEVKHGDKTLTEKGQGCYAHIRDINNYVGEVGNLQKIKEDMIAIFNQKCELETYDHARKNW